MGKVLIIGIFVIGAIFTLIILSVQPEESPELLSSNLAEIQAKQLCREALIYGINKIGDGEVSITPNTSVLKSYSNSSFQVGDSVIDSIRYTSLTSDAQTDTIIITSYATYNNNNVTFQHRSTALVAWLPRDLTAAITANGFIDVFASADVDGPIVSNLDPPLDFEQFFGVTKETMRDSVADHHLINPPVNPPGCDLITYISSSLTRVTTTSWTGSGVLIIDGNASFNGGTFDGILWVTGNLRVNGNEGFTGAIFVEGTADTRVLGNAQVTFDPDVVNNASSLLSVYGGGVISYGVQFIEYYEDN